jgi:hypothetical protein
VNPAELEDERGLGRPPAPAGAAAGPDVPPDLGWEGALAEGAKEAIREVVHAEFDEVLPHLLEALRRNKAFDEINDRLRAAERRIAARQERPVIIGVHGVLDRLRHLEFDPVIKRTLEGDLARVLTDAGYQETGRVGEPYDPQRHEALQGHARGGTAVVRTVYTRGLAASDDTVIRAKVEIAPARPAPLADENTRS